MEEIETGQQNIEVDTTTENVDNEKQIEQLIDLFTVMFSKVGLESDPYINSNIRQNRVPIEIIAQAPRVVEITDNVDTIKKALFECKSIEATEEGVIVKQEQLTLVLRNIPSATPSNDIIGIFQRLTVDGKPCPTPQSIKSEMNDMWFVTFATKEDALLAHKAIIKETFNDQPIKARLKTESITKSYHSAPPQFNPIMPMPEFPMPPQMFFPGYQMGAPMPNMMPPMMGGVMPPMMGYPIVMRGRPMQWAPGTMPIQMQQQPQQNQFMMRPGGGRQQNANKNPRSPRGNVNGRGFQSQTGDAQYFYQHGRGPNPRGWGGNNKYLQYQGYRVQDETGNVVMDELGAPIPSENMDQINGGVLMDNDMLASRDQTGDSFVPLPDGMMILGENIQSRSHDDGDNRGRKNRKNKKHGSADDGDLPDSPRTRNDDKDRNSRGRNDKGDKNRQKNNNNNNKSLPIANFNVESDFPTLGGVSSKVATNTLTSGWSAAAARMTVAPINTTASDTTKHATNNKKTNEVSQQNMPSSSLSEAKGNTKNNNMGGVIGINAPADLPSITFGTFEKPLGLEEKANVPIAPSNTKSNNNTSNDVTLQSVAAVNTQENNKDQKNVNNNTKRSFLDVVASK